MERVLRTGAADLPCTASADAISNEAAHRRSPSQPDAYATLDESARRGMGETKAMSYTSQTPSDARLIERAVSQYFPKVKFLEIGVFEFHTSRAIKDLCDRNGAALDFWGIDDYTHPMFRDRIPPVPPFPCNFVAGHSHEVAHLLPDDFDVILVDGDHSLPAVLLDTIIYGAKVRRGGLILFHDTSPHIQQTMREQHGPEHRWFFNSVNEAHRLMNFPTGEWVLWEESHDEKSIWGGIRAYIKK